MTNSLVHGKIAAKEYKTVFKGKYFENIWIRLSSIDTDLVCDVLDGENDTKMF